MDIGGEAVVDGGRPRVLWWASVVNTQHRRAGVVDESHEQIAMGFASAEAEGTSVEV